MSKRIVLLQALASTANDLRRIIQGATSPSPMTSEWSLSDVLNHFIYVEEQYLLRLQQVINQEKPTLPTIQPDPTQHNLETPLPQLLSLFTEAREKTIHYLQSLPIAAWQRQAIHQTRGETTLRFLVQQLVDHDTEHLNQCIQIKQSREPNYERRRN